MTQKISKTLILKRCYMPEGFNISLENIFRSIKSSLPEHRERVFRSDLITTHFISNVEEKSNQENGVYVSILSHDSSSMGLINFVKSDAAEIDEQEAPTDKAWLGNQILLHITDNAIICCNIGSRESFLAAMITDLAKKAGAVNDDFVMRIADVCNKTEIERVNKIGVKEIDLSLTSYISSFERFRSVSPIRNLKETILDTILGVPDGNLQSIKNRNSIMTSLRLRHCC